MIFYEVWWARLSHIPTRSHENAICRGARYISTAAAADSDLHFLAGGIHLSASLHQHFYR